MKLYFLYFLVFFSGYIFGQNIDNELLKVYSKKELSSLTKEDRKVLEYAMKNAIYYVNTNEKQEISELKQIKINTQLSNFIDYKLKLKDKNQYFVDKSIGKMMVVKSWYVLRNELKNSK